MLATSYSWRAGGSCRSMDLPRIGIGIGWDQNRWRSVLVAASDAKIFFFFWGFSFSGFFSGFLAISVCLSRDSWRCGSSEALCSSYRPSS